MDVILARILQSTRDSLDRGEVDVWAAMGAMPIEDAPVMRL